MPKYQPLDLIGGFYTDDALPWSAQDTVNWLPLAAEVSGTRTVTKLRSPPGLLLFSTMDPDPVRGTRNVEGRLFSVAGTSLYEVATSGTPTDRGDIPGVGRVSMAHNQIAFGNQLTIVNSDSSGYVWNTVTNTLTKITDPGFEGSIQTDFLDGYMLHVDPFGRFWFHSDLADALSFNTLDRYESEASPDKIVGLKAFQSEVVVFNDSTIEFFVNVGGPAGSTFENKQIVINKGCASRHSIARINNTLAWLGDDGSVYILNGYREQKISTVPIEIAIAGLNWSQAFAEVWEDQGHEIYYLTFPDGRSWGYDFRSGLWTRRESYELNRWRVNSLTFWQGKWIAGDFQSGKLYELAWKDSDGQGVYHENGAPMVSERVTGSSHSNQNRVFCPYLELMFDTGHGNSLGLGLSGNLPDGVANTTAGTMQYQPSGGLPPYSFEIISGSLPPGATMDDAGLVTYAYTTGGVFEWVVRVTDVFGDTFDLPDSATVGEVVWDYSWTFVANAGLSGAATSKVEWSPTLGIAVYTEGTPAQTVPDYTTNGTAWLNGSPDLTQRNAVAWSPALQMFAGGRDGTGSNVAVRSTNGINWTLGPGAPDFYGGSVMSWAPDLGQFLGVGGGTGGTFTGWRKSTDGINWTSGVVGPTGAGDARVLVRGAGVYVALSSTNESVLRRIMWSTNGETGWTPVGTFNTGFVDCKWVPEKNLFIAVGSTGVIAQRFVITSPDGKVWTDVTPAGLATDPYGVEFVPEINQFVLTMNTSTTTPVAFYTCTTPSTGGWTSHAGFPGGNFKSLKWLGAPIYRLVVISNIGAQGNGAAYSNSALVIP